MNIKSFVDGLSIEKIKTVFVENKISTTDNLEIDSVRESFENPGHHKISFLILNHTKETEITISYICTDMSVIDDWNLNSNEWEKSSGDFKSPADLIGYVFKRTVEENTAKLREWLAGAVIKMQAYINYGVLLVDDFDEYFDELTGENILMECLKDEDCLPVYAEISPRMLKEIEDYYGVTDCRTK